jgi:hypothetical protein
MQLDVIVEETDDDGSGVYRGTSGGGAATTGRLMTTHGRARDGYDRAEPDIMVHSF